MKFFIMAMGAIHGDHGIMVIQITEFLDGVASSRLNTVCIPIRTIDLQKGNLKCYLKE